MIHSTSDTHTTRRIHKTLSQWHTNLPIAPQLLQNPSPTIITKSKSLQTDGWSCGLHMLLINLATIYQATLPTLRHTQTHVCPSPFSHTPTIRLDRITRPKRPLHSPGTTHHRPQTTMDNKPHNLQYPRTNKPPLHHTSPKPNTHHITPPNSTNPNL